MNFARVIGHVWATVKEDSMTGLRMFIIQPLTAELKEVGKPLIGVDTVDSRPNDIVYFVTSNESVFPIPPDFAPVDCAIVGLVDRIDLPPIKKKPLPVTS